MGQDLIVNSNPRVPRTQTAFKSRPTRQASKGTSNKLEPFTRMVVILLWREKKASAGNCLPREITFSLFIPTERIQSASRFFSA